MRLYLFVTCLLLTTPAVAVNISDIVYWNPRVLTNVLTNKDILIEKEIDCLLKSIHTKPFVSTPKEFNIDCLKVLLACGKNIDADSIYSKCAKLAVLLIKEQNKYIKMCTDNAEQAKSEYGVCSVVEGGKCDSGKTVVKHQTSLPATVYDKLKILETQEHFVCEYGRWKKSQEDVLVEKYPDLNDLKSYFRNGERCITKPMTDTGTENWDIKYANELNRLVDCDVEKQKCMYVVEFERPETTKTDTMIFCCKLHGDFSVSEYDRFHHEMTVDEMKVREVNFYDFCDNTSYDED